jgi:hypothetical protein
MPGVYGGPSIFEATIHGADDTEALIDLPQHNKTRVGAYLRAPEINHDRAVEVGPQGLFLAATISEHLKSSRPGDFGLSSYVVTKIMALFCSVPPHNVGNI